MSNHENDVFQRNENVFSGFYVHYKDLNQFIHDNPDYRPIGTKGDYYFVSNEILPLLKHRVFFYCSSCGMLHYVKVMPFDYMELLLKRRHFIEDCFPYLSIEEKERIVSGMCSNCLRKNR